MPKQTFHGGNHTHNYPPPTQQELDLQSKKTRTFRIAPKLDEHLEKDAKRKGVKPSSLIEIIILNHYKSDQKIKELYAVLENIIYKKF